MIDNEKIRFINTFAPWFSALGTFAAVCVSLHLARMNNNIRLAVTAGFRTIVFPDSPFPFSEHICIDIANIGNRTATITSILWKAGIIKKKRAAQISWENKLSSRFPVKLLPGEQASYFIPLDKNRTWISSFNKDIMGGYSWLKARSTKIVIGTSVGVEFESRIEKSLRTLMATMSDDKKRN